MYGQTTVGHDWCRSSKNATTNDYGGATVHHDISRFPCSPVGIHVVFTQAIVQFVCLLYTLSQFVQLEKCVGSLMSLPFPLCSHYPLIDRWSVLYRCVIWIQCRNHMYLLCPFWTCRSLTIFNYISRYANVKDYPHSQLKSASSTECRSNTDNLMWMEGNLFTPSRDRRPFVEDRSQPWHVRQ